MVIYIVLFIYYALGLVDGRTGARHIYYLLFEELQRGVLRTGRGRRYFPPPLLPENL